MTSKQVRQRARVAILAGALLLPAALPAQETGIAVGSKAPVVAVKDLDGALVDLGQWIGKKPMIIEWWATWCENCEALMPRLRAARALVGDKVEFLGINVTVNQSPTRVRRYMDENVVPFRVLYDSEATSTRAYLAPATSFIVILDAAGTVVYTGVGADQQFEPALKRVAGVTN